MKASHLTAVALTLRTLLATMTVALADEAKMPAVGDKAPLVKGVDQDGKDWKLSHFIGKKVVLLCCCPN